MFSYIIVSRDLYDGHAAGFHGACEFGDTFFEIIPGVAYGQIFLEKSLCQRPPEGSCRAMSLVTHGSKNSMGCVNSFDPGLESACDILCPHDCWHFPAGCCIAYFAWPHV